MTEKKKQSSNDVSEDIAQLKELLGDTVQHIKDSVSNKSQELKDTIANKSQDSLKTAYKYAADEPLKSVGIALLAGFVLGICLKS